MSKQKTSLKGKLIVVAAIIAVGTIFIGGLFDSPKQQQDSTTSYHDFKADSRDFGTAAQAFTEAQ